MLPDEGDNEKPEIIIEEEKKNSKKQEDLITEAFEEQTFEETKQRKDPEEVSSLSEIGEGDLMLEESKDETWVGDEPKKKEENYKTKEASTDKSKGKKKKAVIDQKVAGQLTEDNTPANADEGEAVEGFTGEASLPNTEMETSKGDFLLEPAEEEDGTTSIEKEMEREDVEVKKKTKKIEERRNLKVEKLEKEGSKKKSSGDDILKAKKDRVKEPAIEKGGKMGGSFERFKKKRSDNKDLTGEAMAQEIADQETPADLIERDMHGGVEDSETSASKTRKIKEEKLENTEINIHANENGGKDRQTPMKKIKLKVKEKDSQPESEKGSVRTSAENKEVNKEDKAKSQFKKKKVKFDKLKKEENSDVKEDDAEVFSDKAVEKFPKISTTPQEKGEKSFKKVEIKEKNPISDDKTKEGFEHSKFADGSSGEDTQNLKILEVVDDKIDEAEKDLSTGEEYPDNKHVKSSQEEVPNTQKQEGKLDLRVQGSAEEEA
ncbi:hypothetical protein L7F22_043439 [Adiantum nelumboides]|nr:hypothetical protein [Adiantum nelumboides]